MVLPTTLKKKHSLKDINILEECKGFFEGITGESAKMLKNL